MSYHVQHYENHFVYPNWLKVCKYIEKLGFSLRDIIEIENGRWWIENKQNPFNVIEIERNDDEYTWEGICNNAADKPHLSPELKAKDEARYQANQYAMEHGEPDAESFDCPEEQIEYYCEKFNLYFDIKGNVITD